MLDGSHDGIDTAHVEEGLLLTGKRRIRRNVFRSGGGAHGKGCLEPRAQLVIALAHRLLQSGLEGHFHPVADLLTGPVEGGDVIHIQTVEQGHGSCR